MVPTSKVAAENNVNQTRLKKRKLLRMSLLVLDHNTCGTFYQYSLKITIIHLPYLLRHRTPLLLYKEENLF